MAILGTWFGLMVLVLFNGMVCLVLPRLLSLDWGWVVSVSPAQDSLEPEAPSMKAEVEDDGASIGAIQS
ncbi:MAG: hypothetical protein R6U67_09775 [Sodalinema sp.]|uniref:hypothetical protein n=1 Tax=Sodalinema sp. TaxID=3080550 RepID=UPI001219939A|nr:MAG: hypothetical protein EYR95_02395 [Phormidium sp. SL48-SHIP]